MPNLAHPLLQPQLIKCIVIYFYFNFTSRSFFEFSILMLQVYRYILEVLQANWSLGMVWNCWQKQPKFYPTIHHFCFYFRLYYTWYRTSFEFKTLCYTSIMFNVWTIIMYYLLCGQAPQTEFEKKKHLLKLNLIIPLLQHYSIWTIFHSFKKVQSKLEKPSV